MRATLTASTRWGARVAAINLQSDSWHHAIAQRVRRLPTAYRSAKNPRFRHSAPSATSANLAARDR